MVFEELLGFEGGHASCTGGGDGLAVAAVLDVSAGEDAGDVLAVARDEDVAVGEDVSVGIEVELAAKHFGVGDVADAEEEEGDGQFAELAGLDVAQLQAAHLFLFDAENLFHHRAGHELDVGMGHGALHHDAAGAEAFRTVDERDFGGEASEKERLFHGRVAAADDCDLLAGGEEAVAGGAGADAVADERLLAGQAKPTGAGSAGDDERAGVDGFLAGAEVQDEGMPAEVGGDKVRHLQFRAEADGLLLHVLDEVWALDTLGPSGEVFYQGGDGELAAGFVAFQDERLEVGAGSVDGGSQACAAGTEDDSVAGWIVGHKD